MTILFFLISTALAWETDNFSCRYEHLEDASVPVNAEVNRRMHDVLTIGLPTSRKQSHVELQRRVLEVGFEALNDNDREMVDAEVRAFMETRSIVDFSEGLRVWSSHPGAPMPMQGCNRSELFAVMRGAIASPFLGTIGTWVEGESTISTCNPEGIGIYSGFHPAWGPALSTVGLSPTVKIGGVLLGTDKIEHFLSEGFQYYERVQQGGSLDDALALGTFEENNHYGLIPSGIKSYGDMASNYSGYLFWRKLIDGDIPYIRCVGDRWVQVRQFDIRNFVNPAWDESINCSDYATEGMRAHVDLNLANLQRAQGAEVRACPLDPAACTRMAQFIPDAAARAAVVNPRCLNARVSATLPVDGEKNDTAR